MVLVIADCSNKKFSLTTVQETMNVCKHISSINVPICDYILTPVACAALVNEVMKNLLYQRSQIPYPYAWLKNVVTKKLSSTKIEENSIQNLTLGKHYQVVLKAYESVESVMSEIIKVFAQYGALLREVIFVIGTTPFSPKEVFTIKVSSLACGHIERNHVVENSRRQSKILRNIFLENSWMDLAVKSQSCANTYVFLKLHGYVNNDFKPDENIFTPCKPLSVASNVRHVVINLIYSENDQFTCCNKLEVFKDSCDVNSPSKSGNVHLKIVKQASENDQTELWLQSKVLIQGFKDCFVNKVSACELW